MSLSSKLNAKLVNIVLLLVAAAIGGGLAYPKYKQNLELTEKINQNSAKATEYSKKLADVDALKLDPSVKLIRSATTAKSNLGAIPNFKVIGESSGVDARFGLNTLKIEGEGSYSNLVPILKGIRSADWSITGLKVDGAKFTVSAQYTEGSIK